jgi:hypothetical protein
VIAHAMIELHNLTALVQRLSDWRDQPRALEQGMMQELLTGRARLV